MPREIIVRVAPNGDVKVETSGFQGADCLKATKDLEAALGSKSSDRPKPEMHQAQQLKNTH